MAIGRIPEPGTGIPESIIAAKGDLIAGTANDTPGILTAGSNETRLVADSSTATGLKYVADTTNYAIAAKGDLLVGTGADTLAALTVGTNGHTLVADSATATGLKWAAASSGGMTEITSGSLSGSTVTISSIPTGYIDLKLYINNPFTSGGAAIRVRTNGVTTNYSQNYINDNMVKALDSDSSFTFGMATSTSADDNNYAFEVFNYLELDRHIVHLSGARYGQDVGSMFGVGCNQDSAAITSITLFPDGGTFSGGTYKLYGVK